MAKNLAEPGSLEHRLESLETLFPTPSAKASVKGRSDRAAEIAKAVLAIEMLMGQESAVKAEAKGLAARGVDLRGLCRNYKAIKPYLDILLEAVDWVPYGSTIRKVVKLLMKFADEGCKG
jgi:hypothetical protein